MNILVVTQHYWPEQFRITDIVETLVQRGHKVTVLTGLPNYPKGKILENYRKLLPFREKHNGVNIIRTPLIPRGKGRNFMLALNYLSFALSSTFFSFFYCREKYDATFVFQTSPITQALAAISMKILRRIPCLLWVQDLWPDSLTATGKCNNKRINALLSRFVKFIYKHSDKILVSSRAYKEHVLQHTHEPHKVSYYPNACEDIYKPLRKIRDTSPTLPDGFCVVFAGNIGAAQSIPTIIAAAKQLKNSRQIKWVFVGDGSAREALQTAIIENELATTVFWLGAHPLEAMPGIFARADVLLATLSKQPIFSLAVPSKIPSYLACAKPVIAAIDGETARIINEAKAGKAVAAQDATALANAVKALYELPQDERSTLGQNGFAYYQQHFNKSMLIDMLEVHFEKPRKPA